MNQRRSWVWEAAFWSVLAATMVASAWSGQSNNSSYSLALAACGVVATWSMLLTSSLSAGRSRSSPANRIAAATLGCLWVAGGAWLSWAIAAFSELDDQMAERPYSSVSSLWLPAAVAFVLAAAPMLAIRAVASAAAKR